MTTTRALALGGALLLSACASDQRRLVRLQNARAYHADRQVAACSVAAPAINCNVSGHALVQWKRDEDLAIEASGRACTVAPSAACATHGMMTDALAALKRDRAATRKAGVR